MNQQINQLQKAKKLITKAQGDMRKAHNILTSMAADRSAIRRLGNALEDASRSTKIIEQQQARIDRKTQREVNSPLAGGS